MNKKKRIPYGLYCYSSSRCPEDEDYIKCPFWSCKKDKDPQENGYCDYLKRGDWEVDGISLLWDQVKECGINRYPEIFFFLDFDGVINSDESVKKALKNNPSLNKAFELFNKGKLNWTKSKELIQELLICPNLIKNLNILFDKYPEAHFIVSSNWGRRFSLSKIKEILEPFLPVEVLDITPKKFSSSKVHEIPFWLHDFFNDYDNWRERIIREEHKIVIIDDLDYGFNFGKFFKIDDEIGITKENIQEIINYIEGE